MSRTPNHAYCIGTSSQHRHFMVNLDSPRAVEILRIDQPDFQFFGTEIDVRNRREIKEQVFRFKLGTTLHLVASREVVGWYYIMMATEQRMRSTWRRPNWPHLEMLRQSTPESP